MSGPAKAGLFLYVKELVRLAEYYSTLLQMAELHRTADLVVLQSEDIQLVLHAIPAHIAKDISITSPPQLREQTPLKFFFTIPSIEDARSVAAKLGGGVLAEQWSAPTFHVCNAFDPEGNIFQLRESIQQ